MDSSNEALEILREIRNELHEMRSELKEQAIVSAVLVQRVTSLEQWRGYVLGIVAALATTVFYVVVMRH